MLKYKDFDNVNILCCDINKYDISCKLLKVNVLANYGSETIISNDIDVRTAYFGFFKDGMWNISDPHEVIKKIGLDWIIDFLYMNNRDKDDFEMF